MSQAGPMAQPAPSDVALVRTRGLRKRVRDGERMLTLLDDISLELEPGVCVALMGPSGSGKSSLLNILGGLDRDYEGEVRVAGQDLHQLSDAALAAFRHRTLGFVFQAFNLLGHLSVLDNVLLPARFGDAAPDVTRANALLARVGLAEMGHRRPATLSGGERQRVAIARALYQRPKLLLCDEPTGSLDRETAAEILRLFSDIVAEGTAMLIATHDEAIAKVASRVIVIDKGRLT